MFQRAILTGIRFYQRAISPLTPPSCRFNPTCSQYAAVAIREHGSARGSWLAFRRILRCHPFSSSGFDPVPPNRRRHPVTEGGPQPTDGRSGTVHLPRAPKV